MSACTFRAGVSPGIHLDRRRIYCVRQPDGRRFAMKARGNVRIRDAELRELLDAETLDESALRRNLADIRRINWLLGWTAFTVGEVARQARSLAQQAPDERRAF